MIYLKWLVLSLLGQKEAIGYQKLFDKPTKNMNIKPKCKI